MVHPRPLLRIVGCQPRAVERVVDIADDRRRLVHGEVAVPQDRHPVERVQREMAGAAHFRFEIVEAVRHLLMGQDDAGHLDVNAAWKAEQGDVRHWGLQAGAGFGFARERTFRHKPSAGEPAKCSAWANALGQPGDCDGARRRFR